LFTKKNILRLTCLLLISSWNAGLYAAEIDFLKELDAEADEIISKKASPVAGSSSNNSSATQVNPSAEPALTEEQKKNKNEFESALRNQLPGTYKLYMRLNHEQRLVVVETYITNDRKMAVATRQLFNMYFNE